MAWNETSDSSTWKAGEGWTGLLPADARKLPMTAMAGLKNVGFTAPAVDGAGVGAGAGASGSGGTGVGVGVGVSCATAAAAASQAAQREMRNRLFR